MAFITDHDTRTGIENGAPALPASCFPNSALSSDPANLGRFCTKRGEQALKEHATRNLTSKPRTEGYKFVADAIKIATPPLCVDSTIDISIGALSRPGVDVRCVTTGAKQVLSTLNRTCHTSGEYVNPSTGYQRSYNRGSDTLSSGEGASYARAPESHISALFDKAPTQLAQQSSPAFLHKVAQPSSPAIPRIVDDSTTTATRYKLALAMYTVNHFPRVPDFFKKLCDLLEVDGTAFCIVACMKQVKNVAKSNPIVKLTPHARFCIGSKYTIQIGKRGFTEYATSLDQFTSYALLSGFEIAGTQPLRAFLPSDRFTRLTAIEKEFVCCYHCFTLVKC
jgi:hypothetical protein